MKLSSLHAALALALMCSGTPKIPLLEKKAPGRMLEPELVGATSEPIAKDAEAVTLRLLETADTLHYALGISP